MPFDSAHCRRRAAAALIWMALASSTGSCAKQEDDVDSADPLSRAKRNVVADRGLGSSRTARRCWAAAFSCSATRRSSRAASPARTQSRCQPGAAAVGSALTGERAGRGLCELKIVHPVHFDPLPLEIRPIEEVAVGDSVYAISSGSGRELSMTKAAVSRNRGRRRQQSDPHLAEADVRPRRQRAVRRLRRAARHERTAPQPERSGGVPLSDGVLTCRSKSRSRSWPKATTAPWEDTKPPAQLQVAAEPTTQAPKTARAQRPMERADCGQSGVQAGREGIPRRHRARIDQARGVSGLGAQIALDRHHFDLVPA